MVLVGDRASEFGALLKRYRLAAALSQEELAEKALISARAISDLERGVNRRARRDTVQQLVNALNLPADEQEALWDAMRHESHGERQSATPQAADSSPHIRTFFIADVRGYTQFTVEHGDEAAAQLAAQFAGLAREMVTLHDGRVIELRGDEALAVFSSARHALRAAVELQDRVSHETMARTTRPLAVGIGIDAGEAIAVGSGYRGAALNLAARLCSLAGAGEVLVSEGVMHLARKVEGLVYVERGAVQLKGFDDPVRVVQVSAGEIASDALMGTSRGRQERPLPIGGFLGSLPAGMLVAREEELARILKGVDAVRRGSGRVMLLAGEPGVGKTRLAQEVTLELRDHGFLVASGRCYEPQHSVPYYPFLEALDSVYGAAPAAIRDDAPRRWSYLGQLLPDQLAAPRTSSAGLEDQQRLFYAVNGFLQAIAAVMPVALLLDDLQWADSASLDLLQHLARHTRADRVLLLGTYRDVDVSWQHPLERVLRDLNRERLLDRVMVPRLRQRETATLMAVTLGENEVTAEFAALVHERTDGNPFFTQEVLRALIDRGDVFRNGGEWDRRGIAEIDVPESVRATIGERLSRLSEATQDLLRQASVLGQTFAFDDLEGMSDTPEEAMEQSLGEASSGGLIRETASDEYSFNHALTQQSLYADLSGRRKRRLHLAAGEAIERLPEWKRSGRVAELAWHFLQADDAKRALDYALSAGNAAETVYAHTDAEAHYRTAVDLARELGADDRELEARERLGHVLRLAGHIEEAFDAFGTLAQLQRARGDDDGYVRALAPLAVIARSLDMERIHALTVRFEGAVDVAERASIAAQAQFHSGLARLRLLSGDVVAGLQEARHGLDLAERGKDPAITLVALQYMARAERANGLDSTPTLERCIHLAGQVNEPEHEASSWLVLALNHVDAGRYLESRQASARALELYRRIGSPFGILNALANIFWFSTMAGHWDDSERSLVERDAILRQISESWAGLAQDEAASLRLWRGDRSAEAQLVKGLVDVRSSVAYLAEWEVFDGRPQAALDHLTLAARAVRAELRGEILSLRAAAHLALGNLDEAERIAEDALAAPDGGGYLEYRVRYLIVLGSVRSAQARHDDAETLLKQAADHTGEFLFLRAQVLHTLGTAYVAAGKHKEARQAFEEALGVFTEIGAVPHAERTRQVLHDVAGEHGTL